MAPRRRAADESAGATAARDLVANMSPTDVRAVINALRSSMWAAAAAVPAPASHQVELPAAPDSPQLFRVKVALDGSRPPVWRRLELRGDITLSELHDVLQTSMGWLDGHLHRFWLGPGKRIWSGPYLLTDVEVDEGEEGTHERDARLDQVVRTPKDRLFYTYDFGDDWTHTITVEGVEPCPPDASPAVCLTGKNAGPPEDIGGVGAYNEVVATLRAAPDRSTLPEPYDEWLPENWDPTEFDVDETNAALATAGASIEDLLANPATALAAAPADAAGIAPVDLAAAVRPWRLLLELAASDGIPLTGAGWMKPAVVERIYTTLDLQQEWIGKGNREDLTAPVAQLRRTAQSLGLLRKRKDRLLVGPKGRAVSGDDMALWRVLTRSLPPRGTFARDATVLWLMRVVETGGADPRESDVVAEQLTRHGWRREDGAEVSGWDASDGYRDVAGIVARLSGSASYRATAARPEVAVAFAREALSEAD
ncbi:MAG: plasmid pRiA4b ORF-3 family protein [Lapillicoccus sp.]